MVRVRGIIVRQGGGVIGGVMRMIAVVQMGGGRSMVGFDGMVLGGEGVCLLEQRAGLVVEWELGRSRGEGRRRRRRRDRRKRRRRRRIILVLQEVGQIAAGRRRRWGDEMVIASAITIAIAADIGRPGKVGAIVMAWMGPKRRVHVRLFESK